MKDKNNTNFKNKDNKKNNTKIHNSPSTPNNSSSTIHHSPFIIHHSSLVPKLRFPEFRDAGPWEVKRLGEVSPAIFDGTHQTPKYTESGVPFFSVENIVSGIKNKFISKEDYLEATKKNKPEKGDILLTRIGKIGVSAIVDWDYEFAIYVTLAVIKKSDQFIPYYLHLYFQSERYQTEIHRRSLPNAVPCKINMDELKKTEVLLPSLPEQQKIADCLSSLDELIELQSKKLEALKAHKKGLMQKLFPCEGETTPSLRFPEFRDAGPWEVKRLGEIFQERNVRNSSGLELLSVTLSDGVVKSSQLERKNNASSDLSNYKKVYPNDIVYNSMRMWQGASGLSKWYGIVSPAYTVIKPLERQVSVFWKYYLKHPVSIEKFKSYSQGVTSDTWNLKFPAFSEIKLPIPNIPEEQQKIADCLSSLDELIEFQTKKLEALKAHKKGLMQQLFPSSDEVQV